LSNQETDSGEKLELPQELLDLTSHAEKDGVDDTPTEPESESEQEE
jgi:hypothetical protein